MELEIYNYLPNYSSEFANNSRLTTLHLSQNALQDLEPGIFDGLTSLQTLDLSSNELKDRL